ncbi:MAG: 30S ribosomal protein S16 [Gammaproteobacteria bacterium]|nr:30S ribosomal protein S16 [Gammaproteobacteria bacterium]
MVSIRLARHGSKKNPFYHITVADRAAKRDGRFIERVGFYNPVARGSAEKLRIDLERFEYWVSVGGQPSETVKKLVQRARKLAAATGSTTVEAESAAATGAAAT